MSTINHSITGDTTTLNVQQKLGAAIGILGLVILLLASFNVNFQPLWLWLTVSLLSIAGGIIWYSKATYQNHPAGIKNDGAFFRSLTSRGLWGYVVGVLLTSFYIILYFYPEYLGLVKGESNTGVIALFDPLSRALSGNPASQWFVYGTLYTIAILFFGIKFIIKYRHSKYHLIRTCSVMFFQLGFAFLIPEFMARMNGDSLNLPYYDLKNIWPLNYYNFEQYRVDGMINSGTIGLALLIFGVASIFIITPILTYFYGKRWYCSWVCGCGGLAETAGDSFRHLSDNSKRAWKIERWLIHTIVVFVTIMTTAVIYSYLGDDTSKYWFTKTTFLLSVGGVLTFVFALVFIFKRDKLQKDAKYGAIGFFVVIMALIGMHFFSDTENIFMIESRSLKKSYGFLIGSIFSGVVGTGFYPILGNRAWCRFGCPMAAILGFQQKLFSKFRITTNGGQCISCGNCSTYCEMGIDVRSYAQKGQNIVRSSCVGCGVCSSVCPRGVLKLENGPTEDRVDDNPIIIGHDGAPKLR
ncbi:MAG: FeS-binding protein [Fluviicola sp.]|nr:MAG: FeS-binding protein [Fluviicola sp.]